MAKVFTPLIGLAVVVALAMAAVFGAMSLTNPAFAAVNTPASDRLAEETWHPQDATQVVHTGEEVEVDITSLIRGGGSNYDPAGTPQITVSPVGRVTGETVSSAYAGISLSMTGGSEGRGRVLVKMTLADETKQTLRIDVEVKEATGPAIVGFIPDQIIGEAVEEDKTVSPEVTAAAGKASKLDVSGYFANGRGTGGEILEYKVKSDTKAAVVISADVAAAKIGYGETATSANGKILLQAPLQSLDGSSAVITVTARVAGKDDTKVDSEAIQIFFVDVVAVGAATDDPADGTVSFDAEGGNTPGKVTRYEFTLPLGTETNTLIHDMVIELEDFGFPSAVGTSSIAVTTDSGTAGAGNDADDYTFTPEDVAVSGEKLLLSMGDITEDTGTGSSSVGDADKGGVYTLGGVNHVVTVVIRSTAGISLPTEAGTYSANITFGENEFDYADLGEPESLETVVNRQVGLDEEDGGRGDTITVTGKGYKNGTSVTFWRDEMTLVMWDDDADDSTAFVRLLLSAKADYEAAVTADATRGSHSLPLPDTDNTVLWNHDGNASTPSVDALVAPNGAKDPDEERLCSAVASGSDVAVCEFEVTNPPFVGAETSNYVNGVDGRGNKSYKSGDDDQRFLLLPSISATPSGGSPGEVMLVQLADFPTGAAVERVELSRTHICGGDAVSNSGNPITCAGSTDGGGNVNISVVIPNWAEPGKQELRVFTARDGGDNITVDIRGPVIQATPGMVVANQRVSLVGSGFFAGAKIGSCDDCNNAAMTVGGDQIDWPRINGGDDVSVDNGGNWSAAVDLPLTSATTAEGKRTIRITDSRGRTGTVDIGIPARRVTITPESGRVGTEAVIRGWNFPSKNDDGDSFNVVIIYDAGNNKQATVTAVPDASGRFETPLRIPTTAGIPSTNTVKVEFDDSDNVKVVTTVTHDVPEGAIRLSRESGSQGSRVTISGEGFKAYVPVQSVKVGAIEVTPSPNPSTDAQGMMNFDVTIPGLDNGIQTIEVKVSGTTASIGFTVTQSGISAGDITESADAVDNLGDNFVRAFNFNNDTKTWTFYDPAAGAANSLDNFITGESYWILVGATQEVILNSKTRNLTCVSGSCWNLIVW